MLAPQLSSRDLLCAARSFSSSGGGGGIKFPSDFPFHKRIPGTRFVVDGFGQLAGAWSTAYFLTHFHSDHYAGLSAAWDKGIIFCSRVTKRLVVESLHVDAALVVELELHQVYRIDDCLVTFVDANHCPGAVQILIEVPENGTRFVHTGDMRYSPVMKEDASLCNFVGADAVFLDTTYCNPKFVFPPQKDSISYIVETIQRIMSEDEQNGTGHLTLFLISTYVIGKEKILLAVAEDCKCSVYVDERKLALLNCLDLEADMLRKFTTIEKQTRVHVVSWNWLGETWPFFRPNFSNMEMTRLEKKVDRVVGFVPTGWTHEVAFPVRKRGPLEIHLVPYSEHSNYDELREYIGFLRPREVFPTVGLDDKGVDGKTAESMKKHFRNLVDETASKRLFLKGFSRKAGRSDGDVDLDDYNEQLAAFGRSARRRSREEFEGPSNLEIKNQLQNILPDWVTDSQIDKLLLQAAGELNVAVSLFFEQQNSLEEGKENAESEGTAEVAAKTIVSSAASSGDLVKGQTPPKLSARSPATPPSRKTPSKVASSTSGKQSKGFKSKTKQKMTNRGQSSILSFFKKECSLAVPGGDADGDLVDTAENKPESSSGPCNSKDQRDSKVRQLLNILEGKISEAGALELLEKGGGDIGAALDLLYGTGHDSGDCEKTLLANCNQEDPQAPSLVKLADNVETLESQWCPKSTQTQTKECPKPTLVTLPPNSYDPITHACWGGQEPAPYLHLARTFDLVEKESGRHKTVEILCNMFRSLIALSPADVLPALYLTTNRIAPDYENVDLNVGVSTVVAAIEEATGTPRSKLKEMYNTMGDFGDVAQACRQTQGMLVQPRPLSISHVFSTLRLISKEGGAGSGSRKKSMVLSLLRSCREKEVTYLVRTLVQNMRIGAMIRTVLPALAQAVLMHQEPASQNLKQMLQEASVAIVEAFNLLPDFERLVSFLLEEGVAALSSRIVLTPGVPLKPMLAKITSGLSDVLKQFEGKLFTCEFKYDGYRAQIHLLDDGSVRIFSRNCENATSRFPDVVQIIQSTMKQGCRSFIVDAELVAVDRADDNKILAFQSLSTRERGRTGTGVNIQNITIHVCVFLFDVMYIDGEPLVKMPFRLRRQRMREIFPIAKPGYLDFAAEMTLGPQEHREEVIQRFFNEAIAASCEGLMVKSLDEGSVYASAKRADSWLKLKKDYVVGLCDSLDLVPIGAWYGNGRKAGWHSPFLLACYDPDQEEYQSVCRVMSGFTDAFYEKMKEFYSEERLLSKKPSYYRTLEQPDVWFQAARVWEIRGADYTVSPVHQAAVGLVHPDRGISLRFPRFIGERIDKSPEDATSPGEIAQHFHAQTRKAVVS